MIDKILNLFLSNGRNKCELGSQLLIQYLEGFVDPGHHLDTISTISTMVDIIIEDISINIPELYNVEQLKTFENNESLQYIFDYSFGNLNIELLFTQAVISSPDLIVFSSVMKASNNTTNESKWYCNALQSRCNGAYIHLVGDRRYVSAPTEQTVLHYNSKFVKSMKYELRFKAMLEYEILSQLTSHFGDSLLHHWFDYNKIPEHKVRYFYGIGQPTNLKDSEEV